MFCTIVCLERWSSFCRHDRPITRSRCGRYRWAGSDGGGPWCRRDQCYGHGTEEQRQERGDAVQPSTLKPSYIRCNSRKRMLSGSRFFGRLCKGKAGSICLHASTTTLRAPCRGHPLFARLCLELASRALAALRVTVPACTV
jgi:hypothetical protein